MTNEIRSQYTSNAAKAIAQVKTSDRLPLSPQGLVEGYLDLVFVVRYQAQRYAVTSEERELNADWICELALDELRLREMKTYTQLRVKAAVGNTLFGWRPPLSLFLSDVPSLFTQSPCTAKVFRI